MGTARLGQELSLFNILQSISKLKSTVYVLVEEREYLVDKIKEMYFEENILHLEPEDIAHHQDIKTPFQRFMEDD